MSLFNLFSESWKQKAYVMTFAFLFFVIPVFPILISPAVVLIFITALFQLPKWSFKGVLFPFLYLPVILYIFYLIGLTFTETAGMITVVTERKLSLLVFPIVFLFLPEIKKLERRLLWKSFIAGTFLHSLLSLSGALLCYCEKLSRDCFFSSSFSYEIHPSYSAFYLIIVLAYLVVSVKIGRAHV